jgi:type IV pilus assembly protein PilN
MIRINLLPVREARRQASLRAQGILLAGAVVAGAAVCAFLHVTISSSIAAERGKIQSAKVELAKLEEARAQVDRFRREKEEIEQKLGVIHRLEESRTGPVRLMEEISTRIPERLWLVELEMQGGVLKMKGTSMDNETVDSFMTNLEASPMIDSVELRQTKLVEGRGLKLVDFEIESRETRPKRKR